MELFRNTLSVTPLLRVFIIIIGLTISLTLALPFSTGYAARRPSIVMLKKDYRENKKYNKEVYGKESVKKVNAALKNTKKERKIIAENRGKPHTKMTREEKNAFRLSAHETLKTGKPVDIMNLGKVKVTKEPIGAKENLNEPKGQ